jgi:hypothetical protein
MCTLTFENSWLGNDEIVLGRSLAKAGLSLFFFRV